MGFAAPSRPVDELLARLEAHDGASWLASTMSNAAEAVGITAPPNAIDKVFCSASATAEQLEAVKDYGKRTLKGALNAEERCQGLAAYFVSIAAALTHHNTLIGAKRADGDRGPRSELHNALLDLAAATELPWTALLGDAAMRSR
jgi:hypothetical protein